MKFFIGLYFLLLILLIQSCSGRIDEFEVISEKEYSIDMNSESIIYIETKNYNIISKIIVDSEIVDVYLMQKDTCILNDSQNTRLDIVFFQKSSMEDNAEVKSIKSKFFIIEKMKSDDPMYKVIIYNKYPIDIHRIELVLNSRMDQQNIIFKLK